VLLGAFPGDDFSVSSGRTRASLRRQPGLRIENDTANSGLGELTAICLGGLTRELAASNPAS